jgi:sugar phosphate isomerase/epimerase
MPFKHSVFTVMTPDLEPGRLIETLAELGYDGVEWRVHNIPPVSGGPANYWGSNKATIDINTIVEKAKDIKKLTDDGGLEVVALGTYLNYKMLDEVKRCMEAAKIMGAGSIRVGAPKYDGSENYNDLLDTATEGYARIENLAKDFKVRATVEIHHGSICSSSSLAYMLVSNFDPDWIGVISDPGNMAHEGYENWQLGLEILGPYLSHVHVKNAAWVCGTDEGGRPEWTVGQAPLREGCVDWKSVIKALDNVGFSGWLSLEDFAPGDTRSKLADGLAYLKSIETELGV